MVILCTIKLAKPDLKTNITNKGCSESWLRIGTVKFKMVIATVRVAAQAAIAIP